VTRWPRRLGQLYAGLALYGFSMALVIRAALGVTPWDVLHLGLIPLTHRTVGEISIAVGALVLLCWVPLRQRPGLGTVSNVFVVGLTVDLGLAVLPPCHLIALRVGALALGIGLNAVATAAYIGARLGPGPRDGLMTGLVARTGWPVRWVRMVIEVTVVLLGWSLGGDFGPGTIIYALAIGPLVHPLLPWFQVSVTPGDRVRIARPAGSLSG